MTTKYPLTVFIETPDGDGEATKREAGDPWMVSVPTRDLRFYGSTPEMKAEVRRVLRSDYPSESITFTT